MRSAMPPRTTVPRNTSPSLFTTTWPPSGTAPSATTTIEKCRPRRSRCRIFSVMGPARKGTRDEDHVGAAGEARPERDPARVPPHHLDDHDPLVGLGRRVQPVDRVDGDVHGRVEPEGDVGADDVVVDRLGHADDPGQARLEEPVGEVQRSVAADRDQRVEPLLPEAPDGSALRSIGTARPRRWARRRRRGCRGWPCPGSCPDVHDAAHPVVVEPDQAAGIVVEEAAVAVADPRPRSPCLDRREGRGADDGVEAGGVAAAGVDGDLADGLRHKRREDRDEPVRSARGAGRCYVAWAVATA